MRMLSHVISSTRNYALILFDAIETIEIALRTKMIYHLSQSFGGLFYTDKKLFVNESLHQQHIEDLMSEFMRSGEVFIKEYKRKYGVWEDGKCTTLTQQPDSWVVLRWQLSELFQRYTRISVINYRKRRELPMTSDLTYTRNSQAGSKLYLI